MAAPIEHLDGLGRTPVVKSGPLVATLVGLGLAAHGVAKLR